MLKNTGITNLSTQELQKTLPEFLGTLKEGSYVTVVYTSNSGFEEYAKDLVARLNKEHPELGADKFKIESQ